MNAKHILVGMLLLGTILPVATAEAAFCPPYNPNALANCSITVDVEDRSVYAPQPSLLICRQYVIGDVFVDYPCLGPTTWVYLGDAPIPYTTGYVEATAICPVLDAVTAQTAPPCRVEWDTRPPSSDVLA